LLVILFLAGGSSLFGQTREELENERMRIIEQIEQTSRLLQRTSASKESTLTDLKLLQDQIANRKKVVANIRQTLDMAEEQLKQENRVQDKLEHKYRMLYRDYTSLLRMSYIKLMTENKLVYLLSSPNWEESLTRWRYSRMIEEYLERQIDSLERTSTQLRSSIARIETDRQQYEDLLTQEEANMRQLEKDEKALDQMLAQLRGDEKRLRGALIRQKQDREKLNQAIESIILAELNKKEAGEGADDRNFALTGAFSEQKRKLPWPVRNPRVLSRYGKQKHPTLENVFISNNGIDIFSDKNAPVQAIFQGEVAGALQIPGNDFMVMIRHGKYYTVYSKLSEVFVAKGDRIAAGHTIGRLGQNNATLHFEIWEEKQKLDPEEWLN
jgi:septal ring factor EnvC (AmiA/AmiB activator)